MDKTQGLQLGAVKSLSLSAEQSSSHGHTQGAVASTAEKFQAAMQAELHSSFMEDSESEGVSMRLREMSDFVRGPHQEMMEVVASVAEGRVPSTAEVMRLQICRSQSDMILGIAQGVAKEVKSGVQTLMRNQ